ncbi:MAG: 30S ribosomal protein S8 [Candidatus Buchananbacteria bacterium RIFCSPLOWO2_01_FULL_46_12]|uniref:Small ribosomal subunit protein uS8 n=2 Tax=Candidatus Buchananiibacteriota TaxID=1817903 RepID=A0A1G1YR73_9BACT|nr:MAG: 30S ribosomal protein S8 [Candidatus Buchananbacteria bacterium RIFCSPHIGHO2_01_FULL_44_11]OGY54858.1 MAG: 30S ribosomal protein S8 [Candidatus Buchananbacteria bacterium RIFCSPLOWO2_01_FULL_46_12]
MTDPISDMLTRIRNAQAVRKADLVVPFSRVKYAIAEILKKEGYVANVEKIDAGTENGLLAIKIVLKYLGPKEPAITDLKRISTPGRRIYVTKDDLPRVLNNIGFAIISTSKGLMTNKQARKQGLGGEIICEIY